MGLSHDQATKQQVPGTRVCVDGKSAVKPDMNTYMHYVHTHINTNVWEDDPRTSWDARNLSAWPSNLDLVAL